MRRELPGFTNPIYTYKPYLGNVLLLQKYRYGASFLAFLVTFISSHISSQLFLSLFFLVSFFLLLLRLFCPSHLLTSFLSPYFLIALPQVKDHTTDFPPSPLSIRSRNGASPRKGCVVNARITSSKQRGSTTPLSLYTRSVFVIPFLDTHSAPASVARVGFKCR